MFTRIFLVFLFFLIVPVCRLFAQQDTVRICDLDVRRSVLARLDTQAFYNAKANYAQGYRIMIYTGNSKDDAIKAKEQAYHIFPKGYVYTDYKIPVFKVRFGNFLNRFSAWLALVKLRTVFPNAMMAEEIVLINP